MAKIKTFYRCQQCNATAPQWHGQCRECEGWGTLAEEVSSPVAQGGRFATYAGEQEATIASLGAISVEELPRQSTGLSEFDRVLGGGLVPGSVVLIGGDPGIGKSTLLLQTCCHVLQSIPCLYVTGEESLQQVRLRASRLQIDADALQVLAHTRVEYIIQQAIHTKPKLLVVDSIQTMHTEDIGSAPGSVSQVRETAAQLVRFAKQTGIILLLVGHVTKEGTLAGPRVLEHMVDAVLYFEGDSGHRLRMVRAIKNRFGAVNELGVFAMTEKGLREMTNPSALFLQQRGRATPGSVVTVLWEGTRPLLVELQALVDDSHVPQPRRVCLGVDHQRLVMLLAVLHRHTGIVTYDQDVFVNMVGGVRVSETGADLATVLAVYSSLKNRALDTQWAAFGELGLSGELRPVPNGQERLKEAAKQGFQHVICPASNVTKKSVFGDLQVHPVSSVQEAIALFQSL